MTSRNISRHGQTSPGGYVVLVENRCSEPEGSWNSAAPRPPLLGSHPFSRLGCWGTPALTSPGAVSQPGVTLKRVEHCRYKKQGSRGHLLGQGRSQSGGREGHFRERGALGPWRFTPWPRTVFSTVTAGTATTAQLADLSSWPRAPVLVLDLSLPGPQAAASGRL